jgi:hypothetical protein
MDFKMLLRTYIGDRWDAIVDECRDRCREIEYSVKITNMYLCIFPKNDEYYEIYPVHNADLIYGEDTDTIIVKIEEDWIRDTNIPALTDAVIDAFEEKEMKLREEEAEAWRINEYR